MVQVVCVGGRPCASPVGGENLGRGDEVGMGRSGWLGCWEHEERAYLFTRVSPPTSQPGSHSLLSLPSCGPLHAISQLRSTLIFTVTQGSGSVPVRQMDTLLCQPLCSGAGNPVWLCLGWRESTGRLGRGERSQVGIQVPGSG